MKEAIPVQNQKPFAFSSKRIVQSLKAKANLKRSRAEFIADWMTARLGSVQFLTANILGFLLWIFVNLGGIPGITPFDPFPFGLLTMMVSLEAIFLAVFVLISQNRAAQIDDLREEIDLQVDIITEQELTKLIHMVKVSMEKNGIDLSRDSELQAMLEPTNIEKIEGILEKQVLG